MENYKIEVNNEDESKEIQELFNKLDYNIVNNISCEKRYVVASRYSNGIKFDCWVAVKEITIQYLRDLVVLKRNSIDDANLKDTFGDIWYVDSTNNYWMFENGIWREAEEPLFKLEPIKKPIEKEAKMKDFLNPEQGYSLVKCFVGETPVPESWIEVPEGAEIFLLDKSWGEDTLYFVKHVENRFHEYYISGTDLPNNTWMKGTIKELHKGMGKVLWQRSPTTLDSKDTTIQEKLKFIEKWLNGEKIQYILGIESEKTQADKSKWHNFTEGAMQYIKRPDIKFREAPKYVTINGIEFKSVEKLVKYVKDNFDLEDGV